MAYSAGIPFCGGGGYWAGGKGWAMASGGAGASWLPCMDTIGLGTERKQVRKGWFHVKVKSTVV